MKLGIDATNIGSGGGFHHLSCLLEAADPEAVGIEAVEVIGGKALEHLPRKRWLTLTRTSHAEWPLSSRLGAQWLRSWTHPMTCDVLFAPAGWTTHRKGRPTVAMAQNILPFMATERERYGISWMTLRLSLLRAAQRRAFQAASEVICLSEHSASILRTELGAGTPIAVIRHGVQPHFFLPPREPPAISRNRPFRIAYVSIIDMYKHQWVVAEAVAMVRRRGYPVEAAFIGPAYPPALGRLMQVMRRLDPAGEFLQYRGPTAQDTVHSAFHMADLFVFASTCEAFSLVVLQAMASGLPIVCSDKEPMSRMLGPAGRFVDPERPESIAAGIQDLFDDPDRRTELATLAFERARNYSWDHTASETMAVLRRASGR